MLSFPDGPRKRRTRQHIIADQSVNHVERVIIDAGHVPHRIGSDYGYDLYLQTFDTDGYAEPGLALVQLKASDALALSAENYSFDLDVRDYNLWKRERLPVVLVLFDAGTRRAYWVHAQAAFAERSPREGAKTVRVRVPKSQPFTARAIRAIQALKAPIAARLEEVPNA